MLAAIDASKSTEQTEVAAEARAAVGVAKGKMRVGRTAQCCCRLELNRLIIREASKDAIA
jgi:hypothetical protein